MTAPAPVDRRGQAAAKMAEISRRDQRRAQAVTDIIEGLKVLDAQREIATQADEMYDGDVGMVYASRQVRKMLTKQGVDEAEIDDFNYARIPVDAVANRLQIAGVKPAPDDDTDGEPLPDDDARMKAADKAIRRFQKRNKLKTEAKRLHTDVSKHGDAFLLVWPIEEGGRVVDVDARVNSAHSVAFIYDPEDQLQPLYVIKSWTVEAGGNVGGAVGTPGKSVVRANLYYQTHTERWATQPGTNPQKRESWQKLSVALDDLADEVDLDPEAGIDPISEVASDEYNNADGEPLDRDDIPNRWGLPWFHFRNGSPLGRPEHANAYGPQKLINKLIYAHAGVIDFTSFPQRYILVDPSQDDPMNNLSDPDHPEIDGEDPEDETATSQLKSDPGVVWRLLGKSTGEYGAADPRNLMEPLDRYVKAMAELTDVPTFAFTKSGADVPSGEALREITGPLVAKVIDRQDRYDPVWEEVYERMLTMLGIDGLSVEVTWVPPQMVNDSAGWQTLKAKTELGVPNQVVLEEGGYAPELVEEWRKDLTGADMLQRVSILERLATAAQAMSAAVQLGGISESTMQAIFDRFIRLAAVGTDDPEKGPDGDTLPAPVFRDPPPTNPAMAAVEAQDEARKRNPDAEIERELKSAQVDQVKASAEGSRASAESTRAMAKLAAQGGGPAAGGGTQKRAGAKVSGQRAGAKATPRRTGGGR